MSFTIYVRIKKIGKQKHTDLESIPFSLDEKPNTTQQLLVSLTKFGVRQYNERKDMGQILVYLTQDAIEA